MVKGVVGGRFKGRRGEEAAGEVVGVEGVK